MTIQQSESPDHASTARESRAAAVVKYAMARSTEARVRRCQ
jgi:hypothetical protein